MLYEKLSFFLWFFLPIVPVKTLAIYLYQGKIVADLLYSRVGTVESFELVDNLLIEDPHKSKQVMVELMGKRGTYKIATDFILSEEDGVGRRLANSFKKTYYAALKKQLLDASVQK